MQAIPVCSRDRFIPFLALEIVHDSFRKEAMPRRRRNPASRNRPGRIRLFVKDRARSLNQLLIQRLNRYFFCWDKRILLGRFYSAGHSRYSGSGLCCQLSGLLQSESDSEDSERGDP